MLPRRRFRNSGRQNDGKRSDRHLAYVRKFECAIAGQMGHVCSGRMEAAHVDYEGSKGMGMKVPDVYTVPFCSEAHREQTALNWTRFEAKYGIDALAMSKEIARRSPAIIEAAREAGHNVGMEYGE